MISILLLVIIIGYQQAAVASSSWYKKKKERAEGIDAGKSINRGYWNHWICRLFDFLCQHNLAILLKSSFFKFTSQAYLSTLFLVTHAPDQVELYKQRFEVKVEQTMPPTVSIKKGKCEFSWWQQSRNTRGYNHCGSNDQTSFFFWKVQEGSWGVEG